LRDYGCDGQVGLERTPEEYVSALVRIFRDVWRVLRGDGTVWLNLGDSYACDRYGSGGTDPSKRTITGGHRNIDEGQNFRGGLRMHGLKPKDLVGIPWRVALALQADGWYLRQDIIWHKPNPMPESVTDRCTKAHEYIFLLSKSERYFYDSDAVKEPAAFRQDSRPRIKYAWGRAIDGSINDIRAGFGLKISREKTRYIETEEEALTRNRRSVWSITSKPFDGAHFATFPPEIPEICILAGSRKGDTVLDPFLGAGTTGLVAETLGRNFVGIEMSPVYVKMAQKRIALATAQGRLFP
jgi:DNA modification methylase